MKMSQVTAVVLVLSAQAFAALPDSLSLDEAIQLTKERQPSLRVAKAQSDAAVARAREQLAPVLPSVNASLAYRRSTSNFTAQPGQAVPTDANGNPIATTTWNSFDYLSGNITAAATVWDFLTGWNRYQSTLSSADAQRAQEHAQQVTALYNVRAAWHTARAQKDLVDVAKATFSNAEAHLQQVQGFVTVGTRPEIDLAQSRSERATAKLNLVTATNNYAVSKAKLNQAMGVEGPVTYDLVGGDMQPLDVETSSTEGLINEALSARPEAVALEAQVKAQDYLNRAIRGTYLPTLGVQVAGTVAANDQISSAAAARNLGPNWTPVPNVSAQLTLNWAIYQGGLTNAQVSEGDAILVQLEGQRDELRLQVRLDVDSAVLSVAAAKEAVDASGDAADAAREQLKLAEGRYAAGAGSVIERGDAQAALTTALGNVVQAKVNLAIARSQLIAALGRI